MTSPTRKIRQNDVTAKTMPRRVVHADLDCDIDGILGKQPAISSLI